MKKRNEIMQEGGSGAISQGGCSIGPDSSISHGYESGSQGNIVKGM